MTIKTDPILDESQVVRNTLEDLSSNLPSEEIPQVDSVRETLEQLLDGLSGNSHDLPQYITHSITQLGQSINGSDNAEIDINKIFLGREGSLVLYPLQREVYVWEGNKRKKVELTPLEFNFLDYLMTNSGKALSYEDMSQKVWGYELFGHGYIKIQVHHLRQKLEKSSIVSVRGGYQCTIPNTNGSLDYHTLQKYREMVRNVNARKRFLGSEDSILLDTLKYEVRVKDGTKRKNVDLKPTEFDLLRYLLINPGIAISYEEISQNVWESEDDAQKELIRTHIANIRREIGQNACYIETVPRFGLKYTLSNLSDSINGAQNDGATNDYSLFEGMVNLQQLILNTITKLNQSLNEIIINENYSPMLNGTNTSKSFLGSPDSLLFYPSEDKVYVKVESGLREINLTPTELDLLEYLMENSGTVLSHNDIFKRVWEYEDLDANILVAMNIGNLRRKIGRTGRDFIKTHRNIGYEFNVINPISIDAHTLDQSIEMQGLEEFVNSSVMSSDQSLNGAVSFIGSEDSISLYPGQREVYVREGDGQRKVNLTSLQFNLLQYLMEKDSIGIPYDELIDNVWKSEKVVDVSWVKDLVTLRIRKELGEYGKYIETVPSFGYRCSIPNSNVTTNRKQYSFGEFTLDIDARLLFSDGKKVHLEQLQYKILSEMVQHTGMIYTHTQLAHTLRPVDEITPEYISLNPKAHIGRLRRIIGNQHIETIKGQGYRFVA